MPLYLVRKTQLERHPSRMRPLAMAAMALAIAALPILRSGAAAAAPPPKPGDDVIQFLSQTTDWYRRAAALDEGAVSTEEVLYRDSVRQHSREAVRLSFDFARAEAGILGERERAAGPATNPAQGTRLERAAATAVQRVNDVQAQLDRVNQEIGKTSEASLPTLIARRDKLSSELELATSRRDVLKDLAGFMSDRANGTAEGLLAQIEDLERSVPDAPTNSGPTQAARGAGVKPTQAKSDTNASAANPQGALHPESAGVFSLLTATFTLPGQLNELNDLANQADTLRQANEKLRRPLRNDLLNAIHQADAISAAPDSDDPAKLADQRQQLDALSSRFRHLSAAAVPLSEQDVVLGAARTSLLQWRRSLERDYTSALRYLLLRLGTMTAAIVVLLALSKLWRHATFRYVGDMRRRRQFLVVRRMVVGVLIMLIVLFTFVSEFASLATFAGILTAGIAVALQTFIVSGVAYFFFVGRFGVRVGERVTISNITGDVVEIGLFRLYLMELGGTGLDRHPTGRIVVFSNSVLFQPSAFFKQIPGAEYSWHQVCLTLAPGSDYQAAERRLVAAVEAVFAEYRDEVDRQYEAINRWIHVPLAKPRPEARLRFIESGVELVIRYPVDNQRAPEIDDRLGRTLLDEINKDPSLKLVGAGVPRIQAAD